MHEEEILKLKEMAKWEFRGEPRKKFIDALAAYGDEGIPHILDLVNSDFREEIKNYGLDKIIEIRKKR
jgi:ABC-type phosphate/phosphonate transport system substrate-binding protein